MKALPTGGRQIEKRAMNYHNVKALLDEISLNAANTILENVSSLAARPGVRPDDIELATVFATNLVAGIETFKRDVLRRLEG
jgi:hypothetical protein